MKGKEADQMKKNGKFDAVTADANHAPTHLVIMVNGLNGSALDWRYAEKQFLKKYPEHLIIHRSECNYLMWTFDGVDVMGTRLADEVCTSLVNHSTFSPFHALMRPILSGHSLGGLVARYAIAKLYSQEFTREDGQEKEKYEYEGTSNSFPRHRQKEKIAGLEPVNFITMASPHLGSRGHKQVPLFNGFYALEELASSMSWFLSRTGKHLFLTDCDDGKPPLLLQMVSDHEDLKFLSALRSFKRRVVYAYVDFDHLVGWETSSIRRQNELPKNQNISKNGPYPHVLNVEMTENVDYAQESAARVQVMGLMTYDLEETMIRALTKLSWERIDVSFKESSLRHFAHNLIQVKHAWITCDGADVVQHMVDHFHL